MNCRICYSSHLFPVIDLGQQPWGNHFLTADQMGKEPIYPLCVVYCTDCSAAQLNYTVPKETMFSDHTYLSGVTHSLSLHFEGIAKTMDQRFFYQKKLKSILDIGSNDGTQLKHFKKLGYEVLGVESSKSTAEIANQNGIFTLNSFFNLELAKSLGQKFDIINASGVFFHLEELHSVTEGIKACLDREGIFIIQFLYMKSIMENGTFDQIYHEHLLYYTLKTLNCLLKRHGLELFDASFSPIHGGSMIGLAGHRGHRSESEQLNDLIRIEEASGCNEIKEYSHFSDKIEKIKMRNVRFLQEEKSKGKTIFGMGAPVKGNTLLNYCGIKSDTINYLVERNEMRKGLFAPGSHIPVIMEYECKNNPDIYFVLAWNFKKEILNRYQSLIKDGVQFYFPVDPEGDIF